jgi:hypothetical protein
MRMIIIRSMWAMLIVGVCGTGNVVAKNVPAPSYDAESNFSGFANGGGPKGPSGGSGAKDYSSTNGNGGKLSIDAESAAGFSRTAR